MAAGCGQRRAGFIQGRSSFLWREAPSGGAVVPAGPELHRTRLERPSPGGVVGDRRTQTEREPNGANDQFRGGMNSELSA